MPDVHVVWEKSRNVTIFSLRREKNALDQKSGEITPLTLCFTVFCLSNSRWAEKAKILLVMCSMFDKQNCSRCLNKMSKICGFKLFYWYILAFIVHFTLPLIKMQEHNFVCFNEDPQQQVIKQKIINFDPFLASNILNISVRIPSRQERQEGKPILEQLILISGNKLLLVVYEFEIETQPQN